MQLATHTWMMLMGAAAVNTRPCMCALNVCADSSCVPACCCICVACAVQVRYARSHQYVQAGTGPEDNRQLFFARAPSSAAEAQLTDLFKQFGEVRDTPRGL